MSRILPAEDAPDIRRLLWVRPHRAGCSVTGVKGGLAALREVTSVLAGLAS